MDNLKIYREEQKKKYEEHMRKIALQKKVIGILTDKSKNPPNVIINFCKKFVLRQTINELNDVPGLYKKRIPISEFNFFEHTIQNQIESDFEIQNKENYNKIVAELTGEYQDDEVKKAIIESLSLNDNIMSTRNPIKDTIFWIQIDLRIFGKTPEISCKLDELDQMIYFTKEQQNILKNIWNKIDPETNNGLRYKQMLDCSKSLVELYNIDTGIIKK